LLLVCISTFPAAGSHISDVPRGSTGLAKDGAVVVAEEGAVVYARKGSNVQYWPGSTLIPRAQAQHIPDCRTATVTATGAQEELRVLSGAEACTEGDSAVVALFGSKVVYDPDVPLIRRPVVRP